ncbi:MAG: disulfide bond formation protein B [Betaproteobacteria bacterium]
MKIKLSARIIFAAIGIICLCLLTAAWYLQYGPQKQQPCPLCILQRYLYMALAVVCLAAVAHGPARVGTMVYAVIADLLASIGVAMAVWQVSKGSSMTTCLSDPIGEFVNGLPMANSWPEFLFANGGCADQYPPILGVPVPVWSLVWFSMFAALIATAIIRTTRAKGNPLPSEL